MRWRRSADHGSGGAFLDGTDSELADFGETGSEGFAAAWDASRAASDSADETMFAPSDDRRSRNARDLDRRSRRWVLIPALIAIIVAGVAIGTQTDVFDSSPDDGPENVVEPVPELQAIAAPRDYDDGPAQVVLTDPAQADRPFRVLENEDPRVADQLPDWAGDVAFGPVFWGGRAHVVITGPAVALEDVCVVATLAADDLRAVDIAASGECTDVYAGTGDRIACARNDVLLLEIWPYDPDGVVEKPAATSLRVRVQRDDPSSGSVDSVRGEMHIDGDLLARADRLPGAPGDIATFDVGDGRFVCELLDRSGEQVQLL